MGALEIAGLTGWELLDKFSQVDQQVYDTMERLSKEAIDSIADLSASLTEWAHGSLSGLTQGSLSKFGGHLAEGIAGEHLSQAGVDIGWPLASNQPGWDLLIEGHEVNIKLVADASSLTQHFARYPEIPVMIPGDAENIPEAAIHFDPSDSVDALLAALGSGDEGIVLVYEALSHADLMEQASDATAAALGGAAPVAEVPVITFALSTWREAKLLHASKTDLISAAKNIGLAVAGTGGGGFAGAEAGAMIGTGIAPGPGTIIGVIVGGLVGALGGRWVTNTLKRRSLRNAIHALKNVQTALAAATREEGDRTNAVFRADREREQATLLAKADTLRQRVERQTQELKGLSESERWLTSETTQRILEAGVHELSGMMERIAVSLRAKGVWTRWLWPDVEVFGLERAAATVTERLSSLRQQLIGSTKGPVKRQDVLSLLGASGTARGLVEEHARALTASRRAREAQLRTVIEEARTQIAEERLGAIKRLGARVEGLVAEARARIAPRIANVAVAADSVTRETGKLGLEFGSA